MLETERLPTKTALRKRSIWRGVSENEFRSHVVDLKWKSHGVPVHPKVHSLQAWEQQHRIQCNESRMLPLAVEQRLADDIAFIAAAAEGVKLVSAVGIEEFTNNSGLVVRLAVNDTFPQHVIEALRTLFNFLQQCASRRLSRHGCSENIFATVKRLCEGRIHARLQSKYWERPSYFRGESREPLYETLEKLITTLRPKTRLRSAQNEMNQIQAWLGDLCTTYKAIDDCANEEAKDALLVTAIRKSYELSTMDGRYRNMKSTIKAYGFNPTEIGQNRSIMQIDKIGRYWGLCLELPEYTRKHRALFEQVKLEYIQSYLPVTSKVFAPSANASSKSHVECHVHAEIQLLVYYDTHTATETFKPRVIGVSKAACYLCDLFMREHGVFFHTKTHGQLYDQWTIPDLAGYSSQQIDEYRRIIRALQIQIVTQSQNGQRHPYPNNSWISRERYVLSPIASDAGTIESRLSVDNSSGSTTPRASVVASLTQAQGSSAVHNSAIHASTERGAPSLTPTPRTPRSEAEPRPQPSSASPAHVRSPLLSASIFLPTEQGARSPTRKPLIPRSAQEPQRQPSHASPVYLQSPPPSSIHHQPTPQNDALPEVLPEGSATPPAMTSNVSATPTERPPSDVPVAPFHSRAPEPSLPFPTSSPTLPATAMERPPSSAPGPPSRSPPPEPSLVPPATASMPSSSSSLSIESSTLPQSTTITKSRPLHLSIAGLSLTVETESPKNSHIRLLKTELDTSEQVHIVDIDALAPGATADFTRDGKDENLVLHLRRGKHQPHITLYLQWC